MHWLEKWRKDHQMSKARFAKRVGVSEALIDILENMNGGITHPQIADAIADYIGATAEQRDSIVHKKHHGTYKPNPRAKRYAFDIEKEKKKEKEKRERKAAERREIVAVNIAGVEQGRYPTLVAAADAHLPCTTTTVSNRAGRKLSPGVNEFMPYGVTFRYADEWDKMPEDKRKEDMRNSVGNRRPYGRQCRKVC